MQSLLNIWELALIKTTFKYNILNRSVSVQFIINAKGQIDIALQNNSYECV